MHSECEHQPLVTKETFTSNIGGGISSTLARSMLDYWNTLLDDIIAHSTGLQAKRQDGTLTLSHDRQHALKVAASLSQVCVTGSFTPYTTYCAVQNQSQSSIRTPMLACGGLCMEL